jgi:hypothetical protein
VVGRHAHTFLKLAATSEDERLVMPYQKTYAFPGPFINQSHHRLALSALHDSSDMINIGIEGWLLPADALKLYEMAYFCGGDILELGTYKGLSTSIMAEASRDSGRDFTISSYWMPSPSSRTWPIRIVNSTSHSSITPTSTSMFTAHAKICIGS